MAFMRRGVFPEVMAVSGLVVLKPNPQRGLMGPLQVRMTWSAANVLRSASARHATLEKVWLALATPQIEAPLIPRFQPASSLHSCWNSLATRSSPLKMK